MQVLSFGSRLSPDGITCVFQILTTIATVLRGGCRYTHAGLLEQAEDVPFRLTRNMSTLMSPVLVEVREN